MVRRPPRPDDLTEAASIFKETAQNLIDQSDALKKQATDLRNEARRLRAVSRKRRRGEKKSA